MLASGHGPPGRRLHPRPRRQATLRLPAEPIPATPGLPAPLAALLGRDFEANALLIDAGARGNVRLTGYAGLPTYPEATPASSICSSTAGR
jgi:hypothetical protein